MTGHPTDALQHRLALIGVEYSAKGLEREAATISEAIEYIFSTPPIADEGPLTQAEQDELVERINANPLLQPINSEGPDFCGYYDDATPNEAAIELNSEGLDALVEKADRIYERCKFWPEQSADGMMALLELRNFYHDTLRAALKASLPTPVIEEGLVEKVARALRPNAWRQLDEGGIGHSLDIMLTESKADARRAIEAIRASNVS